MKLQVGRNYKLRNGLVTMPMQAPDARRESQFRFSTQVPGIAEYMSSIQSWREDGTWAISINNAQSEYDIVADYQDTADLSHAGKLRTWAEENYSKGTHLPLQKQDTNATILGVLQAVLGERLDYSATFKKI